MGKASKTALILAAVFVVLGIALVSVAFLLSGGELRRFSTDDFETNIHPVTESFRSISVTADTADVRLLPSADGTASVRCYETKDEAHTVAVRDGVLTVSVVIDRQWYEYIGVRVADPVITVYLPQTGYDSLLLDVSTGDIEIPEGFTFDSMDISASTGHVKSCASVTGAARIRTSTGSITVEGVSADSLELSVSTGRITVRSAVCTGDIQIHTSTGDARLTDVTCASLISDGSTGDLEMSRVVATERFDLARSTGDVEFERCDAGEVRIKTTTGEVEGSLLSEKVFTVQTDTGDVEVPKSNSGGSCEITTDTGDIEIEICRDK